MKLAATIAALLISTSALAVDCYTIQNPDMRAQCIAQQRSDVGACGMIYDQDQRAVCRARVSGNMSYCDSIRDADKRAQCKAGV